MTIPTTPPPTDEATIQRLITDVRGHAQRVAELEGQLARTQEWLERFQGAAAAETLDGDKLRAMARSMRALLVEADSNLGLWRHRYSGVRMPDDLREDVDDLRRRIHPYVAAGGRGETATTDGVDASGSGLAGSTPAAPTGAVQVSPCALCGSARTMVGNVASCLMCGGTTRPYGPGAGRWCSGCHGCSECKPL